ncbi:hypothetical protein OGATHE_006562 [Ogataea polymorpha]|uniref:Secreted protein n=1 Tax=Ogataea polymorpha TaxID=460523 RepID=A0A9P8SYU0_9ASCO|nr:hypothetical protein OGATHE_006562 [Ogataea polymorpha]
MLKSTICGSLAILTMSSSLSILRAAPNGRCSSEGRIWILGKSSMCTSKGSWMPFLVMMSCLGCSSRGSERTRAATSSADFHLDSCVRLFWPWNAELWMILRNSWPVLGFRMKSAPLRHLTAVLPSKVLCVTTRYTLTSSTKNLFSLLNSSA